MVDKVNTSRFNSITGEVVTQDEYVEMMLRNYEEALELYKQAGDQLGHAKMALFDYMDEQGTNGIPSETYDVRRRQTYNYQKNKSGFLPLLKILNAADLKKAYVEPTPVDGKWNAQQLKVLAESYPQVQEVLERVREAQVTLDFKRREDDK
tara:strand:- start:878 stop:1330 length:453 start_codon:yes stop_codon:yes gene_type:complete